MKKAHSRIDELKEKDESARKKMYDLLNLYEPSMENGKYMLKRTLHLYRQIKNICKKNLTMRRELRAPKKKLKEIQEKDRWNLDFLVAAAKV